MHNCEEAIILFVCISSFDVSNLLSDCLSIIFSLSAQFLIFRIFLY
jgi:hypothetical protein